MNYSEKPISEWSDNAISKFFKTGNFFSAAKYTVAFVLVFAAAILFCCTDMSSLANADKGTDAETTAYLLHCVAGLLLVLRMAYIIVFLLCSKTKKWWYTSFSIGVVSMLINIGMLVYWGVLYKSAFFAFPSIIAIAAAVILFYVLEIFFAIFCRKHEFMKAEVSAEADIRGKAYLETLDEKSVRKLYRKAKNKRISKIAGKILFSVFPILFAVSMLCKIDIITKIYAWVLVAAMAYIICGVLEMLLGFFQKRKDDFQLPISCSVFRSFMNGK